MKEILLTQGKVALIDNADYKRVSKLRWYAEWRHKTWYARTANSGNGKRKYLHRFVFGPSPFDLDHRDGDGLNCQKENLRPSSASKNHANSRLYSTNTSGFRGVTWNKENQKWVAYIKVNYKRIQLGYFRDLNEAGRAYDKAAVKYFGEFVRLNFPA